MFWGTAPPAQAQAAGAWAAEAARLHFQGRTLAARQVLERTLEGPEGRNPAVRIGALEMLLDICIASLADACVQTYADAYVQAVRLAPGTDPPAAGPRARTAAYYFDAGRLALGRPEVTAKILDGATWKTEPTADAAFYLRRQALGARVALAQGKPALALAFLDRSLARVATVGPGEASPYAVAQHLAQAVPLLAEIGQTGRAYGLLRATGGFVGETLPPGSAEAALFTASAGRLMADLGDLKRAAGLLELATTQLTAIELEPAVRDRLLGATLQLRAAMAAPQGDTGSARRFIDAHPLGRLYTEPGRRPQSPDEIAYLASRALVSAVERRPDPVALAALTGASPAPDDLATVVLRDFGRLMLMPPGQEREKVLDGFGARLRTLAVASTGDVPGAWRRTSPMDIVLLALALSGAEAADRDGADLAFALFQLAARVGPTFDGDALTALGAARSEPERAVVHQALRLRARRDRVERAAIQAALARLGRPAEGGAWDAETAAAGRTLADLSARLAAADQAAAKTGAPLSGANIAPLKRFQAVLARDEAALMVAFTPGGLDYMCVRRDRAVRFRRAADHARLLLDIRLLDAALTATHGPSETSDVQFPVEAAVRTHGALIAPFDGCLGAGDRILWLPPVSTFAVPLAALLPQAPPRLARGWDLAQADWLVRRHAVSYAGSASQVVAARSRARRETAAASFLGVGDPLFGRAATGQLRGVRAEDLAALTPLPDTRAELEVSAQGFPAARLLLQADATEAKVRAALATPWRYISFATHGLIRDDLQGLSEPALALTPTSMADPADDGLLTATEIADMALAARFVALSACNTANFDLAEMARELPALASAFALAGVPSTLGTLWPVNTETGRLVVSDTFARLRADPAADPAQALAGAQRAFLAAPPGRPYLHPRFWAPFVVLGDAGMSAR